MNTLVNYVMRGRMQAILVAAALLLLSLLLMPLSWPASFFSAAVVALVTLVQGSREGLLTLSGGTLAVSLFGLLAPGTLIASVGFALLVWSPVWLLATSLRQTVSLSLSLIIGSVLGMAAIAVFFLLTGDPADWWFQHFVNDVLPVLEEAGMVFENRAQLETDLQQASQLMTGSLTAFLLLGTIAGLFIGRRWQAALYNPGGFQTEFYQLRFGMSAALVTLAIIVAGMLTGAALLLNMLLPLMVIFLFQGLAIGHVLIRSRSLKPVWLVGMYMLLILGMPYTPVLFALLGLLDNGLDLRSKFAQHKT